ncbi:NAD(P)-dependent oxidoreductase [Chitinasiproducens palmae]|uniref:3-hydroxyisobutyrate dehydrogenase n=1 Tax=Chitinasiproducens palmae TaxID=1770053 RepID=A0A1H2PQW5_9BURK|nr:NAD(P)-dependent oxidoreductase [Chitinasiproducens palmae]SDV49263.1 3-hydroxyisobutyrate dehydrogenase [Chitinasiproducens palmae]
MPSSQNTARRVAVLGLGSMGGAIAKVLLDSNGPDNLVVWNRSPGRADALVATGATRADSPADAAQRADVLITMLANDAAVEAVALGEGGLVQTMQPGQIHVSMSTISIALAERLTAAHRDAGHRFVTAPVLGRPDVAAQGKLFVAAAGEPATVAEIEPVLATIGQKVFKVGDMPGEAVLTKLIANFLISTVIESLGEAVALGRKGGIAPEQLLEVLTGSIFGAPVVNTYGKLIVEQAFSPAGFALPLGQKDNRLVLEAADALGAALPFANVLRDRFVSARGRGWDNLDWSAVARLPALDAGLDAGPDARLQAGMDSSAGDTEA